VKLLGAAGAPPSLIQIESKPLESNPTAEIDRYPFNRVFAKEPLLFLGINPQSIA
jgi:hypothetical protein